MQPGVTTDELDRICHEACIARGGYPSPLLYKGYPKSLCTSVNEVICHGIPDDRALLEGDIVNCDVTIYLDGVHGDHSETFLVGEVDPEAERLVRVTRECLWHGIAAARPGGRVNDIGRAIQAHAEGEGFGVVRMFVGHGVGREFHTAPSVPHYFDPHADQILEPGLTFTIEPMITAGAYDVGRIWPDGWTAVTADGSLTAQFEHSLLVTPSGVEVLTLLPDEPLELPLRDEPPRAPIASAAVRLAGERALITGSTSGIGRAIAQRFAEQGALVCVTGRDRVRGDEVVAQIDAEGGTAHFVPADLRDEAACAALVASAAERLGGLTILVNNAAGGDGGDGPVGSITTDAWNAILTVEPHRADVADACRDRAPACRGPRLDREHLDAPGRAREPRLRRLRREQGRAERADAFDRGRLRRSQHPLQHDQPRLRAERSSRRRHRRRAPRAATRACTSRGSASPTTSRTRRCTSRRRESDFVTGLNLQVDGGSSIARGLTLG